MTDLPRPGKLHVRPTQRVVEELGMGQEVMQVMTSPDGTRKWLCHDNTTFDRGIYVDVYSVDPEGEHGIFDRLVMPGWQLTIWVQRVEPQHLPRDMREAMARQMGQEPPDEPPGIDLNVRVWEEYGKWRWFVDTIDHVQLGGGTCRTKLEASAEAQQVVAELLRQA